MKKVFLFAAVALVALASCTSEEMIEVTNPQDNSPSGETNAIVFASATQGVTRAGEDLIGATAAEKLGKMFVVEGTKGSEASDAPSSTVVFDNYLVGYNYNSAGTAKSNTNNWEYVGLQTGITGKLESGTWTALHPSGTAQEQSIKYWDYSVDQYDFIAWSTGKLLAVTGTDDAEKNVSVKVTRINTGSTLASNGFTMTALSANDLLECYYTDINTVTKASGNYNKPVTLKFRNMAAKVRVALYETVPGYSVKDVKFYSKEADDPANPDDLGKATAISTTATLFTTGTDKLPQSGAVKVFYPHIGKNHRDASPSQTKDYNKASVTVSTVENGETSTTQTFGTLDAQYRAAEGNEPTGVTFLGKTLPTATYAGSVTADFYQAVIPNTNGKPLTLRLDYTLVSTDGSAEEIHVYGAKAVVPAAYTEWQPNYAYTYIFKISDNSNGWTSKIGTDPNGIFPITFDAVVTSFTDANAEQTTVTTVATPSITTYQQGHTKANNEYKKSQTAGVSSAVKDVYVQVMDNSEATPTLKGDLNGTNKSLLYKITKKNSSDEDVDYVASEAEVMDALQNRTNTISADDPVGRNGVTLTKNSNISNTETQIVNGVDDQPITGFSEGQVAKIAIGNLAIGTYAYVYAETVPGTEEKIYNVVSVDNDTDAKKYYEVSLSTTGSEGLLDTGSEAEPGKVYFIKNLKANGTFDSYTFKQTKVGDNVAGLVEATIPAEKASAYTAGHFYFDVYNKNNGKYAVKVIKVVN